MYWGAADEARSRAEDPKRRTRRLWVAVAVTLMSVGGTVAMASASTTHASGNPVGLARSEQPIGTSPAPTVPASTIPTTTVAPTTVPATTVPATVPPTTVPHRPPPPATTTVPPAARQAVATAVQQRSITPASAPLAGPDTCGAALAYLGAHSAPGFRFECPGYALGHQAMTCVNVAGVCPGAKLIVISVVCPASYMNEAHNSWIMAGLATGSIDPYGYCR